MHGREQHIHIKNKKKALNVIKRLCDRGGGGQEVVFNDGKNRFPSVSKVGDPIPGQAKEESEIISRNIETRGLK